MDNQSNSRRNFFLRFFSNNEKLTKSSRKDETSGTQTTKMLTPDGKLVEVVGPVRKSGRQKQRTTNAEILSWMGIKKNG